MFVPLVRIAVQVGAAIGVDGKFEISCLGTFSQNRSDRTLEQPPLLFLCRNLDRLRQFHPPDARKRDNNVLQRKGMYCANKNPLTLFNSERREPPAQFTSTFAAESDASDPPRGLHIFSKHPGKLDGKGLCLTTPWTSKYNAMPR